MMLSVIVQPVSAAPNGCLIAPFLQDCQGRYHGRAAEAARSTGLRQPVFSAGHSQAAPRTPLESPNAARTTTVSTPSEKA
jgi:hypothetical protein